MDNFKMHLFYFMYSNVGLKKKKEEEKKRKSH